MKIVVALLWWVAFVTLIFARPMVAVGVVVGFLSCMGMLYVVQKEEEGGM
jgi:hypothetical protein